jgi:hypothetical protein
MVSSFDVNHSMYSREIILIVNCLSFGPNREVSFPEAFFCNECKAYEGDKHADPMSKVNRTSRRYKCKGKHTDLKNPSNMGGQPMVYYVSTQLGATFLLAMVTCQQLALALLLESDDDEIQIVK